MLYNHDDYLCKKKKEFWSKFTILFHYVFGHLIHRRNAGLNTIYIGKINCTLIEEMKHRHFFTYELCP